MRKPVNWNRALFNMLTGIVSVVVLVLIYFMIRQCSQPPVEEKLVVEPPKPLQVEILNGCGVTNVAAKFTDYFRARGFDVIRTENYETFNVLETVVIDRRDNRENSLRIAEALGLDESRILVEVNENIFLDATIIIGKDFRQLGSWKYIGKE